MVVVVQTRVGQGLGLLLIEFAEGHAGFQAHGLDAFDHLQHVGHVFGRRVLPRRPHAETGRTDGFGAGSFFQHLLHFHQLLFLQPGVVVAGLRTIFAIFRAGAGLDRQQGGNLHAIGVEMRAVHGLRLKQQIVEGLDEQGLYFGQGPVVTQICSCAGAHGQFLTYSWTGAGAGKAHRRNTDMRHI
ncbi:hypothetical protein D9M73_204020 [compost metagenome]